MFAHPSKTQIGSDEENHPVSTPGQNPSVPFVVSLRVSIILAILNLLIVIAYSSIFGWGWTGILSGTWEQPEHWDWAGGLVGLVALMFRMIAIAVVAVPYGFMLFLGISSALAHIVNKRNRPLAIVLTVAHSILSIPPIVILIVFLF